MASFFRRRRASAKSRQTADRKRTPVRLALEPLEERAVPAQFFVSNTNDLGAGSLRGAIGSANTNANLPGTVDDVIFAPGVSGTITLNGDITIREGVRITGPGALTVTIRQGKAGERIFTFDDCDPLARIEYNVQISGLTLAQGKGGGNGGAILSFGKNFTLIDSEIRDSVAGGRGGAIFHAGGLAGDGFVVARGCTFAGNNAIGGGGAIFFENPADTILENCTFSGNTANNNSGGAISMGPAIDFSQTPPVPVFAVNGITINNCTITNNTAGANRGGGIFIACSPAQYSVTITNSIGAGNRTQDDVFGNVQTPASVNNLIGTNANNNFFNGQQGNSVGTVGNLLDPGIGPLQDNGGTTRTHALLVGSPAIDRARTSALTVVQRGSLRPAGAAPDIGAFELQQVVNPNPNPQPTPPVVTPPPTPGAPIPPATALLQNLLFILSSLSVGGGKVQIAGLTDFNNDGFLDILVIFGRGKKSFLMVLSGGTGLPIFALPLGRR